MRCFGRTDGRTNGTLGNIYGYFPHIFTGTIARTFLEPENDNFVEVVTEMRKSLSWVADLPRHGPGCRAEMEKLYENPGEKEEDEDSEVSI